MTEELKRRGRLATALIAGPAVTVGFLGAGMAPVLADEQADQPPAGDLTENQSEAETDPEAEGGTGGEDGQAASAPDTQDDSVNPSDLGGSVRTRTRKILTARMMSLPVRRMPSLPRKRPPSKPSRGRTVERKL